MAVAGFHDKVWQAMRNVRRQSTSVASGRLLLAMTLAFCAACTKADPDLQIDQPYKRVLLSNPVLRNAGGGIVVTRIVGRPLVIGVGYALISDGHSLDSCGPQVNEARFEALVAAASADAPLRVVSETSTGDFTTVTVVNGEERAEVIEKATRLVTPEFAAVVKGLRPVGRWRGKVGDQDAVFVARERRFLKPRSAIHTANQPGRAVRRRSSEAQMPASPASISWPPR